MKGKAKKLTFVLSLLTVFITASLGICLNLTSVENHTVEAVSTIQTINNKQYSALFGGNVIFSAEKVRVSRYEDENGLPNTLTGANVETFYTTYPTSEGKITFKDIANETQTKTVVDNGQFVKLDNIVQNGNYVVDGANDYQEAIIVSFGSYVYNYNDGAIYVTNADNNSDPEMASLAGITHLEVIAKRNNQSFKAGELPENRNYNNGGRFALDFTYLIMQQEDNSNEGFYEFTFNYMIHNKPETAYFSFYIINNTSYTQTVNPEGKDYGYNSKPTLGWEPQNPADAFEKNGNGGFVRYNIGTTGANNANNTLSYPTITYDYTKYNLTYTHTANQKNTVYEFVVDYERSATKIYPTMNCVITVSGGKPYTKTFDLIDYQEESVNLATILLTEPGTYSITYEFVYNNVDPGFKTEEIKLAVHGMTTYYSKGGYAGARMQSYEIATAPNNHVDVIVPNGFNIEQKIVEPKEIKLGFAYTLVESQTSREGNVLLENSQDAMQNTGMQSRLIEYGGNQITHYQYLSNQENLLNNETENLTKLQTVLNEIEYVSTNQGSLWIEGNDTYRDKKDATTLSSFYFYSPAKISAEDLFKKDSEGNLTNNSSWNKFSNTTSFKTKGYYLVFVRVQPSGLGETDEYVQIFAFQYTSSSTNIEITDGENVIAGGQFTRNNVEISFKKPGVFDRTIQAYYYIATNKNYDKDTMLKQTKNVLPVEEVNSQFVARLGSGVAEGSFARYLIRLESEGESATHKLFTIDRQAISGVQAYLIQELYSGNSVYYSYATDKEGRNIAICNGVTDSLATLSWDDKGSGAKIFATYSYTPFVLSTDTADLSKVINGNGGAKWISTNYKLGTTVGGADLFKTNSPYLVGSECVLFNQGIYIIDLVDEAGNKCCYAFIIDRTESYFDVEDMCVSNTALLFGNNINFSIGDYKVFDLDINDSTPESLRVKTFVEKASQNKVNEIENYYLGNENNATQIAKLFQRVNSEAKYYFTVENKSVTAYEGVVPDQSIFVDSNGNGELVYIPSVHTSYKRTLYITAANHTYSTGNVTTHSYVILEINKDNALGSVYYSNDSSFTSIPGFGDVFTPSTSLKKLDTGSDLLDAGGNVIDSGVKGASATSAKHLAFVWNIGTGNFEVASVTYSYYTLKTSEYHETLDLESGLYFYTLSDSASLYNNGVWNTGLGAGLLGDGRGIVRFNRTSDTKPGLYVVTREYKNIPGADLGDDVSKKNYYFIVDRNGIIETGIGQNIRIELMEGEAVFNKFTTQGTEKGVLTFEDITAESYNIYLTTTKVPAQLHIPTGKYYSNLGTSAEYPAGRLNVRVYYRDIYRQLTNQYRGKTVELFNSIKAQAVMNNIFSGDAFDIDVYEYLTKVSDYPNELVRDRITESSNNGQWLFLSGDYIVRIEDNSFDMHDKPHVKYLCFRIETIENEGPEVDIYNGFAKDGMNKLALENDSATISQEFLKVVLPIYDENEARFAQVDSNYIMVNQIVNGNSREYLYYPYKQTSGIPLTGEDENYYDYVTKDENGNLNIWLNTKLRTSTGEIDYANINTPLSYTITVRYKLNNYDLPYSNTLTLEKLTKYKNCYVYYDDNGVKVDDFFERTYTIIIDRKAPTANIKALNERDSLVKEYNKAFETKKMFEDGLHETNSNLYFTQQYAKYYQDNKQDNQYVYVYNVNENTVLDTADIERFYTRKIASITEYKPIMPVIDISGYTLYYKSAVGINANGKGIYSGLDLDENSYYEIVEMDKAGNATQYLIYYTNSETKLDVGITFSILTTRNEQDQFVVSSLNNNPNKTLFSIQGTNIINHDTNFFKVTVSKQGGAVVYEKLTNLKTDFAGISNEIATILSESSLRNVNLSIETQYSKNSVGLLFYKTDDNISLNAEDLVKDKNGNYHINGEGKRSLNLAGANRTVVSDEQKIIFFATEVQLTTTDDDGNLVVRKFVGKIDVNNFVSYYEIDNGVEIPVDIYIPLLDNKTYLIEMSDVFGPVAPYRFNTSGSEFIVVEFEDNDNNDETNNYYAVVEEMSRHYYGYSNATIKFDKTIYTEVVVEKKVAGGYADAGLVAISTDAVYNQYDLPMISNGTITYRIRLGYGETLEHEYFITIDARLSTVTLRDAITGASTGEIIQIFNNKDYASKDVISSTIGIGRMTMFWSQIEENNYFTYDFRLYEMLKTGEYRKYKNVGGYYTESEDGEVGLNLNGKTSTIIATRSDSAGIYKFVISIYGKDGGYIGNRIYVFQVKAVSSQVYYVVNKLTGEEIKVNSSFKYSELDEIVKADRDFFYRSDVLLLDENSNLPLFITNQEYEVQKLYQSETEDLDMEKEIKLGNSTFTIYRISKKDAYDVFIGVLLVANKTKIVREVEVKVGRNNVESTIISKETSLTIACDKKEEVLVGAFAADTATGILAKNKLMVDIYFNGVLVKSQEFVASAIEKGFFNILGNGQYSFVFRDMAGNVHEFDEDADGDSAETLDKLDVYVLREVVVLINGEVPIKNALYNSEAQLIIYSSSKYEIGSVTLTATRNGTPYKPQGFNPYVFADYGTYRVEITARYPGLTTPLKKILTFTILNIEEARSLIDLTSLNGADITKVVNAYGEDKTDVFLNQIFARGLRVAYEDIIEFADILNITSGKQSFIISYVVEDGIYPRRELEFGFTLNNETPQIKSSLAAGDNTTKEFQITFNEAVLYEQIGEAYVMINDRVVAHITKESINEVRKVTTSYDEFGDGDYYVTLVSSSGIILDSFKVTIKEPLNTWAIIVIIVAVGIVLTIIITVVVLRRKMRIR